MLFYTYSVLRQEPCLVKVGDMTIFNKETGDVEEFVIQIAWWNGK